MMVANPSWLMGVCMKVDTWQHLVQQQPAVHAGDDGDLHITDGMQPVTEWDHFVTISASI